jgi:glycosyl transferase, family 25
MLTCDSYDVPLEPVCEATGVEALRGAVGFPAPRLTAFYLNLDQEVARRHSIERQLSAAGMRAERIDAVDGRKPLPAELSAYFNAEHLMDAGALGCYASHIKAWQKIVRKNLPYSLVLEDDAILAPGLPQLLSDILLSLPSGWDMVQLGTEPDRAVCEVARVGSRRIVQFSRVPPGAVGYLLSRAGARKLLRPEPRLWPIDTDTRRPWLFGLAVYGVVAPPIKHNWSVPSTIRARGCKRWTPRRGLRAAFRNPIRNVQGFLFNWRRLGSARWSLCVCVNGALKVRAVLRRWVPSSLPALPVRRLQRVMHAAIEN